LSAQTIDKEKESGWNLVVIAQNLNLHFDKSQNGAKVYSRYEEWKEKRLQLIVLNASFQVGGIYK